MDAPTTAIDSALLDVDGSCRDMNFDRATWHGVRSLIRQVAADFEDMRVGSTSLDSPGVQVADVNVAVDLVEQNGGFLQILLNGGTNIVRHLQVFASAVPEGPPWVELSFFPEDVLPKPSPEGPFIGWADAVSNTLGASRYFVRYENASWTFGDLTPTAGVFLVRVPATVGETAG